MGERKEIGKIKSAEFGWGGYQDAMIGWSFSLGSDKDSWGVGDFKGAWGIKRSDGALWSEEDRLREIGVAALFVRDLLTAAKKQRLSQLIGLPVEVTFDGNTLRSWRALTEVL